MVERLSELVGFSSLSLDGFSSLPLPLFCLSGFPSLSPPLLPFSIYDMLIFRQLVSHRRVNKSCKSTPINVFFIFGVCLSQDQWHPHTFTGSVISPYFWKCFAKVSLTSSGATSTAQKSRPRISCGRIWTKFLVTIVSMSESSQLTTRTIFHLDSICRTSNLHH